MLMKAALKPKTLALVKHLRLNSPVALVGLWKLRVVIMPTLSSLVALEVVIMTTTSAIRNYKLVIKTTLSFSVDKLYTMWCYRCMKNYNHYSDVTEASLHLKPLTMTRLIIQLLIQTNNIEKSELCISFLVMTDYRTEAWWPRDMEIFSNIVLALCEGNPVGIIVGFPSQRASIILESIPMAWCHHAAILSSIIRNRLNQQPQLKPIYHHYLNQLHWPGGNISMAWYKGHKDNTCDIYTVSKIRNNICRPNVQVTFELYDYFRCLQVFIPNKTIFTKFSLFLVDFKVVPGKSHGFDGHNKRNCLHDRAKVSAWQIVLIFNTIHIFAVTIYYTMRANWITTNKSACLCLWITLKIQILYSLGKTKVLCHI